MAQLLHRTVRRSERARVLERFLRNRLGVVASVAVLWFALTGALGPLFVRTDPLLMDPLNQLLPPGGEHLLGTDMFGRDIFSRVIHGARPSLLIGLGSVGIAMALGCTVGFLGGYYPRLSGFVMRATDVFLAFPSIIVALVFISVLGRGIDKVIYAVALAQAAEFARLAFGLTTAVKAKDFVEAARASGSSDGRIIVRHLLPNTVGPLVVQATVLIPGAIILGATLSFLGLGVPPPYPEWGAMLGECREYLRIAPHLMVGPGAALMIVVLAFNLVGDALRDALDPSLRT